MHDSMEAPSRPRHLFLTGEKQIGKSTVLRRLLAGRTAVTGGFLTVRLRTPEGGAVYMLRAGREEACSPENLLFTKRKGIPSVIPGRFEALGCAILRERVDCDLLIMDELGPAESEAAAFQRAVLDCLDGNVPIYGVLQQGESAFLETIRQHPAVRLITVTEENRDRLPEALEEQGW